MKTGDWPPMKTHRTVLRACLSILVVTFLLPGLSLGWGNTWMGLNLEQAYSALRWRTGLLRGSGVFNLNNAGYSSDIYYGSTSEPVPDGTVAAGLNLRAMLPLEKKIVFDVSASPQYLFYLHTEAERAWNGIFGGNVHFVGDRLYFLASGEYRNTRERVAAELDVNVRREQIGLIGLTLWQVSKDVSFALQARRSSFDYNDSGGIGIRENLNRVEMFVNLRAYLQQVPRTRFSLDAEYGTYAFTADPTALRDSRSYSLYGGIEFIPRTEAGAEVRGISGTILLGYGRIDIRDPAQRDYGGLAGSSRLSVNLIRHLSVRGFYSRSAQFSVFSGIAFYLQTSYGAGLTRFLSRRLDLSYDVSFNSSDYSVSGAESDPPPEASNLYTAHSFRIGIQLKRNLSVTLLANLSTRSSSALIPAGGRNFFGFSLSYGSSPGTTAFISDPIAR